ncbi:MAG: sigma 54-interacting transcriptional regulator [Candidatus Eisenbacteria bacterium]
MSERKRILIVDASESDRRRLEACLSDDYEVRSASTLPVADALPGGPGRVVVETAVGSSGCVAGTKAVSGGLEGMVGSCDAMREVFSLLRRAAAADVGVLIAGECGTGKERAARAVHRLSSRGGRSFVTLSAEAFDASRLPVELFGRPNGSSGPLKGALDHADGGTLLLGGFEHVPPDSQEKLLAYLRTGAFRRAGGDEIVRTDVRVLAATDTVLDPHASACGVRPDLLYRLGVVTVSLPPLRSRGDDVALLACHFFARYRGENGNAVEGFSREALEAVVSHDWPGNIAELENRICRALIVARGSRITPDDLGLELANGGADRTLREARDQLTRDMVVSALRQAVGNVSKAARAIGVSRATMYDLIRKHDLDVAGFKDVAVAGASGAGPRVAPPGAETV